MSNERPVLIKKEQKIPYDYQKKIFTPITRACIITSTLGQWLLLGAVKKKNLID